MERRHRSHDYGDKWMIAAAILESSDTMPALKQYFNTVGRRFGVFFDLVFSKGGRHESNDLRTFLVESLEETRRDSWVISGGDKYVLTDTSKAEATKMLQELDKSGQMFRKVTRPETVSRITLIVHFVLAAIKLPAALLSGSVGLLNDSLDTLLDGVSSLFVYWGIRRKRA